MGIRADVYALIVSAMRYFFVAAILYILFRIIYHSVNEYNELRRVKNWIERGFAKHIEFLPPFNSNEEGFILAKYNLIGRSSSCDICIDDRSVKRKHAVIYEKRDKVILKRLGRGRVKINGEKTEKRKTQLTGGELIQLGDAKFYYKLNRIPFKQEGDENE